MVGGGQEQLSAVRATTAAAVAGSSRIDRATGDGRTEGGGAGGARTRVGCGLIAAVRGALMVMTALVSEDVEIVEDLACEIGGRRFVTNAAGFGFDWLGVSLFVR